MKYLAAMASVLLIQGCSVFSSCELPDTKKAQKDRLQSIASTLPAEHQARHIYRNPVKTLSFFGIQPGDTVVEILPGGGWYSQILAPYLGSEGRLIGVDYSFDMFPLFGGFATPEFLAKRKVWPQEWTAKAQNWSGNTGFKAEAYTFSTLPSNLTGQADAVLFIRALHNLARFEEQGDYLTQAITETHRMLKPGGIVGIVQHAMSEDKPDAWATGSLGYLKHSFLMKTMEDAGFDFVAETNVNQNPKDDVQEGEYVWRLPPSSRAANATEAQKAKYKAIGESNRVTLLFRKK